MKKLKIAIVSPFPPSKGTLNEYGYHLVSNFVQKDEIEHITILSDHLPGEESYNEDEFGDKVSIIPCWKFNSMMILFHILFQIIRTKPDLVFFNIHFLSFGDKKIQAGLGLLLPGLCRLLGFPSTVLLHNITETVDLEEAGITSNKILQKLFGMMGYILTKIILQANLVAFTISKYAEIIGTKYQAKNIALVPHGSFEIPELPTYFERPHKNIMTFGKFGTYKKVDLLIEAVARVRKSTGKKIELVIAGSDSPNAKGYLQNVQEKYQDLPNITFTGYVPEEDVPGLFKNCDFTVFPYSSTTGSSGVLHQAGSYGRAAIMPKIGDLKSLIEEEGYTGEFFEPNNLDDLTRAIDRLVNDVRYCQDLGKHNYVASASLPMEDLTDWYLLHFWRITDKRTPKNPIQMTNSFKRLKRA